MLEKISNFGLVLNKQQQKSVSGGDLIPIGGNNDIAYRCYKDGSYLGCSTTDSLCSAYGPGVTVLISPNCF